MLDKFKDLVVEYYKNKNIDVDKYNIFVVWYCKTIQNHKAILGAYVEDNLLFEATYNGNKGEIYLDVYNKIDKIISKE